MFPSAARNDGIADEKIADEICGSLKMMRGEEQTERREERGGRERRGNSLFLCLLLLIKEKNTLRSLFTHPVREKETENKRYCEKEGTGVQERLMEGK